MKSFTPRGAADLPRRGLFFLPPSLYETALWRANLKKNDAWSEEKHPQTSKIAGQHMSHGTWTHASSIFLRVVWPALCSHRDRFDLCISLSPVSLPFFLSFFLPVHLCFCPPPPPPPPVVCEDREEPRSWFQYLWRHQRPGEPLQTLRYGTTRPGLPANRSFRAPPTALPQSCHGNSCSLAAAFPSICLSVWGVMMATTINSVCELLKLKMQPNPKPKLLFADSVLMSRFMFFWGVGGGGR